MTEPLVAAEGWRAVDAALEDFDGHSAVFHIPYERIDSYKTDFARGSFSAGLRARDASGQRLPMCWNHDANEVIGSTKSWKDRGDHLRLENTFADFSAVPKAREVHSLIRDGHITGVSFHYRNGRTVEHPQSRGARRFTSATLMESSPVTFASIPGAVVAGVRSAGPGSVMAYQAYPQSMWDDRRRRSDRGGFAWLAAVMASGPDELGRDTGVREALRKLDRRLGGFRGSMEVSDAMDLEDEFDNGVERALAKLDRRLAGRGRRY